MKLHMPVKVFFQENAVKENGKELAMLGKKAMIVTGKHSSKVNGSLDDVVKAFTDNNIPYVIFDDIEENPSVETVAKAASMAVAEGVDFFVGIGGGSPMDASKAISLLAKNPELIPDARVKLYEKSEHKAYPVAAVPTTSGTGSEVTQYAILTLHDNHTKKSMAHYVFPEVAFVDAGYLKTSSYKNMVSTCVDALAHAIESYLNTNSNDMNRVYAREAMRLWGLSKAGLLSEESFKNMSDEDYARFMHASVMAGMSIAHTGTSLPHGLSYPVTYEMGVPHGKAVGMFLPAFIKAYEGKADVKAVLDILGFTNEEEFEKYINTLLGHTDISDDIWSKDVQDILSNPAKLKNYPFEMTEQLLNTFRK